MVDYCDYEHGVSLNVYDSYRLILKNLKLAIEAGSTAIMYGGMALQMILPSGWVIPIIENGVCPIVVPDVKKFWCLRISFQGWEGDVKLIDFPFPKQNIKSLWQALVAPIDYYVPGSELWPYYDEEDGTIKQGTFFDPPRKFGILSDGPSALTDISLILAIAWILGKLGLFGVAKRFVMNMTAKWKAHQMTARTKSILQEIQSTHTDVHGLQEDLDYVTNLALENKVDLKSIEPALVELKDGLTAIQTSIGVRFLLR